jgi:pilus assembly protein Flp/PilA
MVARFALAFVRDEGGATAIEYGLIVSLIFLVVVSSMTAFGNRASGVFNTAANAINSAI